MWLVKPSAFSCFIFMSVSLQSKQNSRNNRVQLGKYLGQETLGSQNRYQNSQEAWSKIVSLQALVTTHLIRFLLDWAWSCFIPNATCVCHWNLVSGPQHHVWSTKSHSRSSPGRVFISGNLREREQVSRWGTSHLLRPNFQYHVGPAAVTMGWLPRFFFFWLGWGGGIESLRSEHSKLAYT